MFHHPQLDINCYDSPDILFQQLKNQTYDLLFTDIQMPTLNGFELLKKLRSLPYEQAHNIPVVALTARSDIDEQQFVAKGFAGCLHKPYSQKEVLQLIEGHHRLDIGRSSPILTSLSRSITAPGRRRIQLLCPDSLF